MVDGPGASGWKPAEDKTQVGQFLVVNASELLERLAYYGVLSVTALYLSDEGYSTRAIGLLFAVLLPLPYVVPLLAAPLAGRLGYRPVMLASFVGYAAGFLAIFASSQLLPVLGGILLIGIGAGLFKPLTAAAIGLLTSTKARSFGYSVYYFGINIGGFLGPILVAWLGSYRLAYAVGAATIAVDFLLVFLRFRNPVEPKRTLGLVDAVRPFGEVLRNGRFLGLLLIFAGFWVLYSMNFSFVILYLQDFIDRPGWFKPGLQVSLESAAVIAFALPLGAVATRMEAVRTMALGIALLVLGFLLVGFAPAFPTFVAGILLVAAGEVLAYPGFLAYVSRIAPPDRVAVYQGVGFLPLFIGFLIGPILGGYLYGSLVDEASRPALFWAVMCAVGVAALAALLVYAKAIRPKDAGPAPRWQGTPAALAVGLLGVLAIVVAAAADPLVELAPEAEEFEPVPGGTVLAMVEGTAQEGTPVEEEIAIPLGATNVTFALEWSDEAAGSPVPGATNQPDSFEVEVLDRFGTRIGEANGSQGVAAVDATFTGASTVAVRITLVAAGDTVLLGQVVAPDTANDWTLTVVVN